MREEIKHIKKRRNHINSKQKHTHISTYTDRKRGHLSP